MSDNVRQALAERMRISAQQLNRLCSLADRCAAEQEDYHNTGHNPDDSLRALESFAGELGFAIDWPGLWPVLKRDGQMFYIPE